MNFKHCTQDEIYPTRYLVLQVIDIAKPHCHLSSEAESLWGFLHCLTSYISSRRLVSKSYLWSYLYGQSLFSRAVSVLICTSILNGIWRPKRISVWSCCCFTVKTKFYACKLHKQHIWGTNDEPFFKLPFLLLLKPSLLWLMRLKSDGWLTICELTVPDWIFLTDVACFILFRPFFLGVHCKHLFIWIFRCVMCNFDTWVELHDSGKTCMSWLI